MPTCPNQVIPDPSIHLSSNSFSTTFTSEAPVRNLVVTFDPHLSFSKHIIKVSRSCCMHIRDLCRIRPMLNFKTASTITKSIVHSKLDYCNSLFLNFDFTKYSIQNSLARSVTRTPRHHRITPVLKSLHWLKIPEFIHFKVLSITYNSLQSPQPTYLRQLFTIQPTRSARSSSCLTLSRPRSLLISCSPAEPYPSLHHVFGMTFCPNYAPFLYLYHRHCQSQDIIFIRLLYPSPQALPLKTNMLSPQKLLP